MQFIGGATCSTADFVVLPYPEPCREIQWWIGEFWPAQRECRILAWRAMANGSPGDVDAGLESPGMRRATEAP